MPYYPVRTWPKMETAEQRERRMNSNSQRSYFETHIGPPYGMETEFQLWGEIYQPPKDQWPKE